MDEIIFPAIRHSNTTGYTYKFLDYNIGIIIGVPEGRSSKLLGEKRNRLTPITDVSYWRKVNTSIEDIYKVF